MKRAVLGLLLSLGACSGAPDSNGGKRAAAPAVSSTIALSSDDRALWVVSPDADSVSLLDPQARTLLAEIALGPVPTVDPTTQRYDPPVKPRALALLPDDSKLYVAAQVAGRVLVVDTKTRAVVGSIPVGAEPTGIVAAQDGSAVYVVSHQAATVARIDPRTDQVTATLPVGEHPFGCSLSADGRTLYVTQFLLDPGVTSIDTGSFTVSHVLPLEEQAPDPASKLVPNGVARGLYAAVPRPESDGELWVPHLLLAVKTPQPSLDFESTVFPTVSTISADGRSAGRRLLFKPLTVPGASGAFSTSISGPRALAFTPDGALALQVNSASEDVTVFDAASGNERALVRPLPAALLEGIAIDHAGTHAYVDGRNTHNVVVLAIDASDPVAPVRVDGEPIERLAADPMPEQLRLGQRLFYTANSSVYPITQNFWVACASCHLEGRSDAVTWLFSVGPRDTPSNAGGPIHTGFLLRQAQRNDLTQYDTTIDTEQGGNFHRDQPAQKPLLDALAAFVNYAIPFPENPNRAADGTLTDAQARGQVTFDQECASCHSGAYFTDSGVGNPTLDLAGPIVLHDVGTCVKDGSFPDQPTVDDVGGAPRTACDFDTPTLRGIFESAPYFHDGSAATLRDVVDRLEVSAGLSDGAKRDLVEYLKTL